MAASFLICREYIFDRASAAAVIHPVHDRFHDVRHIEETDGAVDEGVKGGLLGGVQGGTL